MTTAHMGNAAETGKPASEALVLALETSVDIAAVQPLHQELLGLLPRTSSVLIEARRVRRVDSAGLQLLVAFFQEARRRDVRLSWENPSPALLDAARRLGLLKELELDNIG